MNVPLPLSVTVPKVPVVSKDATLRMSLVSGSVSLASTLAVMTAVSSSVEAVSLFAVGPSFSPLMVRSKVWIVTPPLPSSAVTVIVSTAVSPTAR